MTSTRLRDSGHRSGGVASSPRRACRQLMRAEQYTACVDVSSAPDATRLYQRFFLGTLLHMLMCLDVIAHARHQELDGKMERLGTLK